MVKELQHGGLGVKEGVCAGEGEALDLIWYFPLKNKQTMAADEKQATNDVPPELSAEWHIPETNYCMVLYCMCSPDSSTQ